MAGRDFSININADLSGLQSAADNIKSTLTGIDAAVDSTQNNLTEFARLSDNLNSLNDTLQLLNESLQMMGIRMQDSSTSMGDMNDRTAEYASYIEQARQKTQQFTDEGTQGMKSFGDAMKDAFGNTFNFGAQISAIGDIVAGKGGTAGGILTQTIAGTLRSTGGLNGLMDMLKGGGGGIGQAGGDTMAALGEGTTPAIGSMLSMGTSGMEALLGGGLMAEGGLLGSIVPVLGTIAGAAIGAMATAVLDKIPEIGDAFTSMIDTIVSRAAEEEQRQLRAGVAFGDNTAWANQQAGALAGQSGGLYTQSQMLTAMTSLQMAAGDKMTPQQVAQLSGVAGQMSNISGQDITSTTRQLQYGLEYGNTRMLRSIQASTGIDLSAATMEQEVGGADKWKALGAEGQMQERMKVLTDPENQNKLLEIQSKYLDTINGQMQKMNATQEEINDAFAKLGNLAVPVLKFMNEVWDRIAPILEHFANKLNDIATMFGSMQGSNPFGDISDALNSINWDAIQSGFDGIATAIMYIVGIVKELWPLFNGVVGLVVWAANAIIGAFNDIINAIGGIIKAVYVFVGIWMSSQGSITDKAIDSWGYILNGALDMFGGIVSFFINIIGGLKEKWDELCNWLTNTFLNFGKSLIDAIKGVPLLGDLVKGFSDDRFDSNMAAIKVAQDAQITADKLQTTNAQAIWASMMSEQGGFKDNMFGMWAPGLNWRDYTGGKMEDKYKIPNLDELLKGFQNVTDALQAPPVPDAGTQQLSNDINSLGNTIAGKNMSSKIDIYITQTFAAGTDAATVQAAGNSAEAAVVSALNKKGIVPS